MKHADGEFELNVVNTVRGERNRANQGLIHTSLPMARAIFSRDPRLPNAQRNPEFLSRAISILLDVKRKVRKRVKLRSRSFKISFSTSLTTLG